MNTKDDKLTMDLWNEFPRLKHIENGRFAIQSAIGELTAYTEDEVPLFKMTKGENLDTEGMTAWLHGGEVPGIVTWIN